MKDTAILLICAVALAAAKPTEEIDLNILGCPVDSEITKFLPHKNCHEFYQCVGGVPIAHICPADLLFNTELNICDWPLNVVCDDRIIVEDRPDTGSSNEEDRPEGNGHSNPSLAPEICAAAESDGVLVAHEHCNEFYVCERRRPVAIQCPENLLYNYENEQCDWPRNVECGDRIIPELAEEEDVQEKDKIIVVPPISEAAAVCALDDSESVLVAHENCNRFYKCSGGKPVALDCPAGLLYNINGQYCDWASNVECGERTIAEEDKEEDVEDNNVNNGAWVPEHGHTDASQASAICSIKGSDGVLVAHENCSQFYMCSAGVPVALNCPAFLLYHSELEICDWPQNVDCSGRSVITDVNP